MKINDISKNNFEGKIRFDKKMSKPLVDYVNRVLDYPINGITAREKIAKRTYDLGVYNITTKKSVYPKIAFLTSFKVAGEDSYYKSKIRTNYSIMHAAKEMARYIKWVDEIKEGLYGYNNFFEGIASTWRNFFSKN